MLVQYHDPDLHDVTCSGSLIKENAVLTAAHCCEKIQNLTKMYDDKYTDYSVLAGTPDLKSFIHKVSPEIPIKAIYIHENYRPPIENENDLAAINDICIIKLEHSFNITNDIQVVQMNKNRENLELETHCHVSGWGLDEV